MKYEKLFLISISSCSYHSKAGICSGIAVSPRSPPISHLLFADDCFVFPHFDVYEVWCLKWFLDAYCDQAGQKINLRKSEIYVSTNMTQSDINLLSQILEIKVVAKPGVYLGASLDFSVRKGDVFNSVLQKMFNKMQGLKTPTLALPGRTVEVFWLNILSVLSLSISSRPFGLLPT